MDAAVLSTASSFPHLVYSDVIHYTLPPLSINHSGVLSRRMTELKLVEQESNFTARSLLIGSILVDNCLSTLGSNRPIGACHDRLRSTKWSLVKRAVFAKTAQSDISINQGKYKVKRITQYNRELLENLLQTIP